MKKLILFFLCGVLSVSVGSQAILLVDNNSSTDIDPTSMAGQYSWITDGTENIFQQWFWYRIGDSGPEASIDTIATPLVSVADVDFDPGDETLNLRYANASLQIDLTMVLSGGTLGSGVSDLGELITITNLGDSALDFHFFQYVDFDLGFDDLDDSVSLVNGNTFIQTDGGSGWISETADAPAAARYEANYYSATLDKLTDLDADVLNMVASAGVGDVTWAFQWDFELAPDDSYIISKDKHLEIPEPATLVLLGLGGLLIRSKK